MKDKGLIILFSLLALIILSALFASFIAPYSPYDTDLTNKFAPVSLEHILGTDHLGRDVFSRIIYGSRMSLISVLTTILIVLILSLIVGSIAGFRGGLFDSILMRICDVFLTFPTFILALFFIGVLGAGLINVIKNYVLAAKCLGSSRFKIVLKHIMPKVLSQVIILAALDLGHMMLHVAGLSFLGLGVQAPTAEWGVMINDAAPYIREHPELMLYPGICIFITVAVFNSIGEKLRDKYETKEYSSESELCVKS